MSENNMRFEQDYATETKKISEAPRELSVGDIVVISRGFKRIESTEKNQWGKDYQKVRYAVPAVRGGIHIVALLNEYEFGGVADKFRADAKLQSVEFTKEARPNQSRAPARRY